MTTTDLARRAARRVVRAARPSPPGAAAPAPAPVERFDGWLRLAATQLDPLEERFRADPAADLRAFAGLDDDLWGMLLAQQQDAYPAIAAALPTVPDPALQEVWNGASGARMADQTTRTYRRLRERIAQRSPVALADARVLDLGCGWGRLIRCFARDVPPERLHGCDPVEAILDVCRQARVPATFTRSAFVPDELPYDEPFDVAYAFSVFTHLSEASHLACLRALHGALEPGGVLLVTIRPPAYADLAPDLAARRATQAAGWEERPTYLFAAHEATEDHLQHDGGEMHYGDTILTLAYVRERWDPLFELLDVDVALGDLHQVLLTLRRRPDPA